MSGWETSFVWNATRWPLSQSKSEVETLRLPADFFWLQSLNRQWWVIPLQASNVCVCVKPARRSATPHNRAVRPGQPALFPARPQPAIFAEGGALLPSRRHGVHPLGSTLSNHLVVSAPSVSPQVLLISGDQVLVGKYESLQKATGAEGVLVTDSTQTDVMGQGPLVMVPKAQGSGAAGSSGPPEPQQQLLDKMEQLQATVAQLKADKARLERDNAYLKNWKAQAERDNNALQAENRQLLAEVDSLQKFVEPESPLMGGGGGDGQQVCQALCAGGAVVVRRAATKERGHHILRISDVRLTRIQIPEKGLTHPSPP